MGNASPGGNAYIPPSTLNSRNRVALIGDSISQYSTQYQNLPTAANSFSVSNGVATLNVGVNVQVFSGNYFNLVNPGDPAMAHVDNGRCIQAVTGATGNAASTSITFNTTAANSDYSNPYAGAQWQIVNLVQSTDSGYFAWLNNFSRGQMMVVANYGCINATSQQVVNILPKIITGPKFDLAFVCCGTNDINGAATAAAAQAAVITAIANIATILATLQSYGAQIVLVIPPPLGTAIVNATFKTPAAMQLRTLIYKLALANQNVRVLDLFREGINGTSSVNGGGFITNGSTDGVHPAAALLCSTGRNQIATALPSMPTLDNFGVTVMDDNINFAQSGIGFPNTVQNAGMVGTTGTLAGGTTGSAASSWTLTNNGATTVGTGGFTRTAIGNSNSANWGFAQRVQCTFGAVGQGFTLQSPNNAAAITTGWYRIGIGIYVRANTAGLASLVLNWNLGNITGANIAGSATNLFNLLAGDVIWLTSGPLYMTANPNNNFLQLIANSSAAGSLDIEVFSPYTRQIDNPYA